MKILQIKKTNFYDVFLNNGWKHHTRIFYKQNKVGHVSGNILPKIKYIEIAKTIGAQNG